jgi:hypothetical protein
MVSRNLQMFFGTKERAALFLDNFDNFETTEPGHRKRKVFLDMFAPEKEDSDGDGNDLLDLVLESGHSAHVGTFLTKVSAVISFLKSAEELLDAGLPTSAITDNETRSSQSTTANTIFRNDPLKFEYLNRSTSRARLDAIDAFRNAIRNVKSFFYDEPFRKFVRCEGDVL